MCDEQVRGFVDTELESGPLWPERVAVASDSVSGSWPPLRSSMILRGRQTVAWAVKCDRFRDCVLNLDRIWG